ncbi:MAG TPA: hypothetical protein VFN46_01805 [Acetobacteraceae bacterium]|nr:hypothetical protein [Acetobacteraceae bacterium]
MELNVLLRGQSNAQLLLNSSDWNNVATQVEQLLGFNGTTDKVNLLASQNQTANDNTVVGGTAFVGDWITPVNGNYQNGWTNNTLENGLLNYINGLPASVKAAPTAIVWLQNEYDSTNPTLTTAEWVSGVQYEAQQVRAALGQTAATTPYVFVNAIPYGDNLIPAVNQDIKTGMALFAGNPAFHATVGAQADDTNMDYQQTGNYGGPHMDAADANQTDHRLAVMLAQEFAAYAQPGSPVAQGRVDGYGPEVMGAQRVGGNQVLVTTALDQAALSATLSTDAANGVGWSIRDNGQSLNATAAQVVDGSHVLLTFGSPVPTDGTAALYYAYGYGRLATGASDPGQGNAIYDAQQMPVWTPATGVPVMVGTPSGIFVEQNMVTGGVAEVQGTTSSIPTYQSEFAAVGPDSVTLTATTPNAFLIGGTGQDVLIATSGSNLLDAGTGNTLMVGGTGRDYFVIDGSVAHGSVAIDNFHAGDQVVLWGATPGASQVSWAETAQGMAVATVSGGGITSATTIGFMNTDLAAARQFAIGGGLSGTQHYLTIGNG